MKLHLNITGKLGFILVLFSVALLSSLGAFAYTSGRVGLQEAATSELLTRAIEKQAALEGWVSEARVHITALAADITVVEQAAALLSAAPGSPEAQAAHDHLVHHFQPYTGSIAGFTELFFIDPETGQVLAATDPGEEGKFKEHLSFFINGKSAPYVSEMYYSISLGNPSMTAAAPIISDDGRLLGVLAGRLNLDILSTLISRRTGLHQTDDAFLTNSIGLLVTQPRFISVPRILHPTLKTKAIKSCLEGNSGVISADDYRGVSALISYRWLPERQMCLIVKIDQAEAFAPSLAFGTTVAWASGLALVLGLALAIRLARSFTNPILALQAGAARLGQGDLGYRVVVKSQDEIGSLAAEFNEMAASLEKQIAERKQAEMELQAQKEFAFQVMNNMGNGLTVTNTGGKFEFVNSTYARMLGVSPQALIGKNPIEFTILEDQAAQGQVWMRRAQGETTTYEVRLQRANGTNFPVSITGVPRLQDGKFAGSIAVVTDLTERKQAEVAIKRRDRILEALAYSGERLLISNALEECLPDVLSRIGKAVEVSRVYIFENHSGADGEMLTSQRYEWVEEGIISQIDNPDMQNYNLVSNGFSRWIETMEQGGTICGNIREFPESEHDVLSNQEIQSILAVPIFVEHKWWGFIGNDDCLAEREWFATEIDALKTAADTLGAAIQRKQAEETIHRQLNRQTALRRIDAAITGSLDLQLVLNVVLEQTITQLNMDAASVLLHNSQTQTITYAAGRGFRTDALQYTRLRLGEGYAGRAALERQLIHIPDLRGRTTDFLRSPSFLAEGFVVYYVVPLIAKGEVKGVLEVFHRAPYEADDEWLDFLHSLAGQAAIAVDNAGLFEGLQRANIELVMAYDTTIEGWSHALDLRDKETEGHTLRVTEMTERLARAMVIGDAELVHIRRGALLHDIGKMGVPDSILLKPDKLTDEEWEIMRMHPVYSYEMLSPIAYLRPALDIPYYHHEKWDGSGYPRGLKGEGIPLAARIFAVVDVWDALRSDRPYRKAWPEERVREYIHEQVGKHFDPTVVETFLHLYQEEF